MVFDQTADLAGTLRRIAAFFRDESCGQCVPCRVGTVRQEELLARLAAGTPNGSPRRRAASPRRDRPGDARRLDLRPGPDGLVGDRERGPGGYRVGMSRRSDPVLPAGPLEQAARPAAGAAGGPARPDDRRPGRQRPAGSTILDCLPGQGRRHADPVLPREPDPGERLPGVRGRGGRLARPRPGLLAQGRGRDGRPDRHRAGPAVAQARPRAARLVGRPVDLAPGAGYFERYGADPERFGPPAGPAGADERDGLEAGHHHAAGGRADRGDGRPAGQDRQRALRPRLLEVHPLLQVRRGLRGGRPEHVRDRGRRARLRCPDLDRMERRPARLGLRLLRQLHRRLPDRAP